MLRINKNSIRNSETIFPVKTFILTGLNCLCLILAWQNEFSAFMIFFAFIPFFFLLDSSIKSYNDKLSLHIFSFLSVFFWIYFTLYWIKPVNSVPHLVLSILSSVLLFLPYISAYFLRFNRIKSSYLSAFVFVLTWISIEILHDIGILGFPYLNLGHILANYPKLIQWYQYTGPIGGTVWIFIINFYIYYIFQIILNKPVINKKIYLKIALLSILIFFPVIFSLRIFKTSDLIVDNRINVLAVHTSVDVFNYKYKVDPEVLLDEYLEITTPHIDTSFVNLIFWPENALTGKIFFNLPDSSILVRKIKKELCFTPNNILITGAIVDERVSIPDPNIYQPNVLFNTRDGYNFKRYNSVLFIRKNKETIINTKKKLVPFSESIPPRKIFYPLLKLLPNLANLNFSVRETELNFLSANDFNLRMSVLICYECAFSTFVAEESLKTRSNLISVLLNESWMRNSRPVFHFNLFSICRAIENKRFIAKSSNDGMSALIDQKGIVQAKIIGHKPGVVKGKLEVNNKLTFYTRHHKFIAFSILVFSFIFILMQLLNITSDKRKKTNV